MELVVSYCNSFYFIFIFLLLSSLRENIAITNFVLVFLIFVPENISVIERKLKFKNLETNLIFFHCENK